MYPAEYFLLFPPLPRDKTVFVAMSFAERFKSRYENVIAPVIRGVGIGGTQLEPDRVDADMISESILIRILRGISHSQFIIADITTIGSIDAQFGGSGSILGAIKRALRERILDRPATLGRAVRNENVLYEVGLAHAQRLYEEVILFRSDNDPLPFDCAQIRVNSYDPDNNPEEARGKIRQAIIRTLESVDNKRRVYIQRLAESLDHFSWWTLLWTSGEGGLSHPRQLPANQVKLSKAIGIMLARLGDIERCRTIDKLLEMQALKMRYRKQTPEEIKRNVESQDTGLFMNYQCTDIGRALLDYAAEQMGMFDDEMVAYMEKKPAGLRALRQYEVP